MTAVASTIHCRPVSLPDHLLVPAARDAIAVNPANAPARAPGTADLPVSYLAGLTSMFWRPGDTITWAFIDNANPAVRRLFGEACQRWMRCCSIKFVESFQAPICKIGRDPREGHYSYIGIGNRQVTGKTMNLAGFTEFTPLSEWERVADHELAHVLGLIHGQKTKWIIDRLDPQGCYAEFGGPPNNWPRSLIDSEILTPENMSLLTDFGPQGIEESVTTYSFPERCTKTRIAIIGGRRITAKDANDVLRIYGAPGGGGVPPDTDPRPDPGGPDPEPDPIDVPTVETGVVMFERWGIVKTVPYQPGAVVSAVLPFLLVTRPIAVQVEEDVAAARPVVELIPPGGAPIAMEMRPASPTAPVQVTRQYRVRGRCEVRVRFTGGTPKRFRLSAFRV